MDGLEKKTCSTCRRSSASEQKGIRACHFRQQMVYAADFCDLFEPNKCKHCKFSEGGMRPSILDCEKRGGDVYALADACQWFEREPGIDDDIGE